jgi:Spy/CpxP family protein refolding chaperone
MIGRNAMKRALAAVSAALLLGVAGCSADGPRAGWGPGMMGPGYGPGMMGPGMMGPGMMGPGMMGPGMMGPGMMGPGMGGYGYGPGGGLPNLSAEQQGQLAEIHREMRARQWPLMQKMHEVMWADPADDQAARANYDSAAALHKQMFDNMLDARKRIDGVLTPEQRAQMRRGPGAR